jgi:Uma2 family endonuclease
LIRILLSKKNVIGFLMVIFYHRDNFIPDIVKESAKRLNKIGSKYYTIDATPNFVVEVNPGESSDRHAVNSAELFASWIKKEFA